MEDTTQKHFEGVDEFSTEEEGKRIYKVARRIPLILFILGFLLRLAFLPIIIPEIGLQFSDATLHWFTFITVKYIMPLLLETLFATCSLAAPFLIAYKSNRVWAGVLIGFGFAGVAYNGIEMYLFVVDHIPISNPDDVNLKNHLLFQLANFAGFLATEVSGIMFVHRGMLSMKREKGSISKNDTPIIEVPRKTFIPEGMEITHDDLRLIPSGFQKVSKNECLIKWGPDDDFIPRTVAQMKACLNTAKNKLEKKPGKENLVDNYRKWQLIMIIFDNTPTPGSAPQARAEVDIFAEN